MLGEGVPSDSLGDVHGVATVELQLEILQKKIPIVAPATRRIDDRASAIVDPFADQPSERLQSLVAGRGRALLVARQSHQPFTVSLEVKHRVTVVLRRLARHRGFFRSSDFNCQVLPDKAN